VKVARPCIRVHSTEPLMNANKREGWTCSPLKSVVVVLNLIRIFAAIYRDPARGVVSGWKGNPSQIHRGRKDGMFHGPEHAENRKGDEAI